MLEQQRALATIGRTYFLQVENLTNKNEINDSLRHAQKSYLKSLDIANNLHDVTSDKEVLEMKARLYLNLGLIYDWEQDTDEALKFVLKALVISRYTFLHQYINCATGLLLRKDKLHAPSFYNFVCVIDHPEK